LPPAVDFLVDFIQYVACRLPLGHIDGIAATYCAVIGRRGASILGAAIPFQKLGVQLFEVLLGHIGVRLMRHELLEARQ
jgi:hypothetical protein